jgi:flagellar biosynthesis protein FlhF
MNIKTLTAPSIQEALAEARALLGDDVVLLESVGARDGQPARVTVMSDATALAATPAPVPVPAESAPAGGYGYAASPRPARPTTPAPPARRSLLPREDFSAPARDGRARLHPAPPAPTFDPAEFERSLGLSVERSVEALLDDRLARLHQRLDALERTSGPLLESAQRWAAHPLFADLLGQGFRPETVGDLFQRAFGEGARPGSDEELRWAVARALRLRLDHTAPTRSATGSLVVMGPSGAGKTSLLLKLAAHPSFYGRLQTSVLVLAPEDTDGLPYHEHADLYRRFGLPVQTARTAEEVRLALDRAAGFDQLLIDTPPLPARPREAQRMAAWIHELLHALVPLDVHFVLDATRALDGFDAGYLQRLPLRPTAVSLTRLDEAFGWGRVAEWMLGLDLPVRFASADARVPDGIRQYTPGWFVEELIQRTAATDGARQTSRPR